ncbi:MAG: hypothetical protein AAGC55_03960 [Myxococcota bacterium]
MTRISPTCHIILWIAALLAAGPALAAAQDATQNTAGSSPADSEPAAAPGERKTATSVWDRGVSDDQRRQAHALFLDGNRLAGEYLFDEAITKYQQALALWPHPGIYYNLARAQNAVGQPLAAHDSAVQAMRYGRAPLGEDEPTRVHNYQRLRTLRDLLRRQLARISLTLGSPEIAVMLDDRPLSDARGRGALVLPGKRNLIIRGPGYQPLVQPIALRPGGDHDFTIVSRRPFTPWKPWVTAGAGALLGITGGLLLTQAHSERSELVTEFNEVCSGASVPCQNDRTGDLIDRWDAVRWRERIGMGSAVLGGGLLLTGAVLALWNQQRRFAITELAGTEVSLTPIIIQGHSGVAMSTSFRGP